MDAYGHNHRLLNRDKPERKQTSCTDPPVFSSQHSLLSFLYLSHTFSFATIKTLAPTTNLYHQ